MGTYIHKFSTWDEFYDAYEGDGYVAPWLSCVEGEQYSVNYNKYDRFNGWQGVDLGLNSGVLWATKNIGAASPVDYGTYFAWGETEPKAGNVFTWNNYKFGTENNVTRYNDVDYEYYLRDIDDAVITNMGGRWYMPNTYDFEELFEGTTSAWTTMSGVAGVLLTSKYNSNTLFFPAAGQAYDLGPINTGTQVRLWTVERDTSNNAFCCYMNNQGSAQHNFSTAKYYGMPIRGIIFDGIPT